MVGISCFGPNVFSPEPRHKRTCAWLRVPCVGAQCQGPTGLAAGLIQQLQGVSINVFLLPMVQQDERRPPPKNTIHLVNMS